MQDISEHPDHRPGDDYPDRDLTAADVVHELHAPAFLIPAPVVRNNDRIPGQGHDLMKLVWAQRWFGSRPVRVAVLEDVIVAQQGLVMTNAFAVVAPTIAQHTAAQVEQARTQARSMAASGRLPRIAGDIVLCRKPGAENYGHWLIELLPRAWLAGQHWPHPFKIMVQAVQGPLRSIMQQSLARLGIGPNAIIEWGAQPVRIQRLILVDGLTDHGIYMSSIVPDILGAITGAIEPAGPDALFITRPARMSRRLEDEDKILSLAQSRGFGVLDPGVLSFTAQVAAFKAARRVVGAMGAGLSNIVFTPPGAEVFTLAPASMSDTFFWFIAGHRGQLLTEIRCLQVRPFTGPAEWDTAIRLDPVDRDHVFAPLPPMGAVAAGAPDPDFTQLFDPAWYLSQNPDIAASGMSPLAHYMEMGWREGRDPSLLFNTAGYLAANADVADAGLNPLLHYITHGRAEGRRPGFP